MAVDKLDVREKVDYKNNAVQEKPDKKLQGLSIKMNFSMDRLMTSSDNKALASSAMAEVGTAIGAQAEKIGAGTGKVAEQISAKLAATSLT